MKEEGGGDRPLLGGGGASKHARPKINTEQNHSKPPTSPRIAYGRVLRDAAGSFSMVDSLYLHSFHYCGVDAGPVLGGGSASEHTRPQIILLGIPRS